LEDVLSYALFTQVAKKFFEERLQGKVVAVDVEKKAEEKSERSQEEVHYITVTM
jgi:oxaloacetate decarboxylase alpha subunit